MIQESLIDWEVTLVLFGVFLSTTVPLDSAENTEKYSNKQVPVMPKYVGFDFSIKANKCIPIGMNRVMTGYIPLIERIPDQHEYKTQYYFLLSQFNLVFLENNISSI